MFYLQSNSEFLSDQLISFFQQKDIHFTLDPNEPVFASISFDQNNQKLSCSLDHQTVHLTLPQHSHFLFISTLDLLKKVSFRYRELIYFPILQSVQVDDKLVNIKNIHNIILSNLFLFLNDGVHKNDLYKMIWPQDKDIQINKLDTHLTNLKTELKNNLDFNLDFSSASGNLKLMIN